MTPPTSIAVTPASNALPPRIRISNAAAEVSGCPVDSPARGPDTAGRWACRPAVADRVSASPIRTTTTVFFCIMTVTPD